MKLTEKSKLILQAIAQGNTYEQILSRNSTWTYLDIFHAAAEALQSEGDSAAGKSYSLTEIRERHPRAYEKWDGAQDELLRTLHVSGKSPKEMATVMQRKVGAIQSRLAKLNLVNPVAPEE
jgi:DNA-directed RNA polymerase specialized sigma24 family protein